MHLISKAIRISRAKFHCNRLKTVQDIQDYASLIFLAHIVQRKSLVSTALHLHKPLSREVKLLLNVAL